MSAANDFDTALAALPAKAEHFARHYRAAIELWARTLGADPREAALGLALDVAELLALAGEPERVAGQHVSGSGV